MDNDVISGLSSLDKHKLYIIKDFLMSEIDPEDQENFNNTIEFVKANNKDKKKKIKHELYDAKNYNRLFLDGNQYLISSFENEVLIIDKVSEDHGVDEEHTRVKLNLKTFIYIIKSKKVI
ncbi:hypothetical protein [Xylocopilactobacillus apicola]|uniref:Uncharacterized protein n=1 Tax=Xylocopilactobacillus apicola TaxID=2932184 RepID=A0AAU9DYP5_9LACO|nr:hypothetical protein [Xylocopilactobacillus apicola]BDR59328.1 hypothetical protein XA3_17690 [Xylocopilactobacillus apicola]